MIQLASNPKQVEFSPDEMIITKTDVKGRITYANRTFMRVADLSEPILMGQPHAIIRHPHMPRGVFYGLWKALQAQQEFFGFIQNLTGSGNYYWVFANITPDYEDGKVQGYYSVRRTAPKEAVNTLKAIYQSMNEIESSASRSSAPEQSWSWLMDHLAKEHGISYEEFILNLYHDHQPKELA
ncbi:PAS domain-containing protein [Reinekea blandensis]|uniref:Aerotaxis receptor n=1 Tax=Reinekea blandensis MED297 TaxID=314283 RepID=A4BBU0_9GAMM|nr:PAS domain-containing protein [Reinekea blandensis]EAR10425.1 aerotaxis receptor [Reinekea sp. MED297] [Reinekea blandensis MED297]